MGKCQDLLEAARNGNVAVVKKILGQCCKRGGPLSSFRRSPSINTQDSNGYTPLHHACLNGHLEIVMVLLAANVTVDMVDVRGSTPLYLAAWSGHYDIVKLLLQHPLQPANANACTIENETPLHAAAQNGYNDIVAILLSYGADPTIHNNGFQTALDLAAIYGRTEVVQTIIRNNPELLQPFRLCDDDTILGRNDNSSIYTTSPVKRIFTHTCLHLAARNGHVDVVDTILKAGVDPNILTNAGTALHEAVLAGQKSVVCSLLKAGVDPYASDGQGRTVWDIFKCYPRHVVAEIAALINEVCEEKTNACDPRHFRPIQVFGNDANDTFASQQIKQNNNRISKINTICRKQKWNNERNLVDYQPVYRIVTINDRLSEMQVTEQTTCLSRSKTISDRPIEQLPYNCFPTNYSHTDRCKQFKGPLRITTNYPDDGVFVIVDVNSEVIKEHSETPEIPPPSASQAESTILTFVKSPEMLSKRKPIISDQTLNFLGLEMENCNHMKSFIWEDFTEPIVEQPDSLNSSRLSEYVEDFVADAPFAGLFKGSSLNLANDSTEGDILNSEIKDRIQTSTFRQSIASVQSTTSAFASESESNAFDFNAAKAWDEINSIFESMANKQSKTKEKSEISMDHSKLNIRKPAELLFNVSEPENLSFNSNWCHSANTLIYSSVAYEVYYLGSTVIRELHGTASTRKSIQRLKCDEKQAADDGLLEDINSSTRILKKNNQQARFKVGIVLSRLGVRFVDSDNQNTICMHSIENINCVCQDADDLRYFAYITREADTYYCHVFMVDDVKLANEIILTLGQAFEVAYQLSLAGQQALKESAHCDMKQPLTYIDIVENI